MAEYAHLNHCIKGSFVRLKFSALFWKSRFVKKKKSGGDGGEAVQLDGRNLHLDTVQTHGLTAGCGPGSLVL